jgi:serine/threonine-protein kinase/endoribonuclease IRE1
MQIEYDREVPLGEGAFSFVFLGKYNGVKVAVKRVQLHNVNENEEKALQLLDHPNIVKLFYSELNADFKYDFFLNYEKKIRNDINKRNFLCFSGFSL